MAKLVLGFFLDEEKPTLLSESNLMKIRVFSIANIGRLFMPLSQFRL